MTRYITDIPRLKKLEKVMERCGVFPVDYFIYAKHPVLPCWILKSIAKKDDHYFATEDQATYDYAALESVLPEWCFTETIPAFSQPLSDKAYDLLHDLAEKICFSRGSEKLNAMCDLVLLLDENGIELKERMNER